MENKKKMNGTKKKAVDSQFKKENVQTEQKMGLAEGVKLKVLVVEDDINYANFITKNLNAAGYEVVLAMDLETAKSKFEELKHELCGVLTDMTFPTRLNEVAIYCGQDLMKMVKSAAPEIPIIVESGVTDPSLLQLLVEKHGANMAIQKANLREIGSIAKRFFRPRRFVPSEALKETIIEVLNSWSDAPGNRLKSENAGPQAAIARRQIANMLACLKDGNFAGASLANRGAWADMSDAGYDGEDCHGDHTLNDLRKAAQTVDDIARGKEVSDDFLKQ